jgi:hypothetical protein
MSVLRRQFVHRKVKVCREHGILARDMIDFSQPVTDTPHAVQKQFEGSAGWTM